jgi:chromosome partitioning protein
MGGVMAKIIAIANQKGGVGKTTTTLNLGAALAERGRQVLIVDLDQQGSLTISVGLNPDELSETVYTVLSSHADPKERNPVPLASVIQQLPNAPLHLVPANIELAASRSRPTTWPRRGSSYSWTRSRL